MIRSVLIYGSSGIVLFEKEWLPVMEKVGRLHYVERVLGANLTRRSRHSSLVASLPRCRSSHARAWG